MNPVVHFEIPADDTDRAKKFYGEIFEWKTQDMPEQDYIIVYSTEVDEKFMPKKTGAINGGMPKRNKIIKVPSFAIEVADIDSYLEKIKAAGGEVVQKKTAVGNMGWLAYFKDTEGNVLSLWQY